MGAFFIYRVQLGGIICKWFFRNASQNAFTFAIICAFNRKRTRSCGHLYPGHIAAISLKLYKLCFFLHLRLFVHPFFPYVIYIVTQIQCIVKHWDQIKRRLIVLVTVPVFVGIRFAHFIELGTLTAKCSVTKPYPSVLAENYICASKMQKKLTTKIFTL